MAIAVSSSEVQGKPIVGSSGNSYIRTDYFEDGPQAFRIESPKPHAVIKPHFHLVNQCQVFVSGSGRIGQAPLTPFALQYADAFSPYGPIVADEDGISFFTIRATPDQSPAHYMPGSRGEMDRKAGRNMVRRMEPGVSLAESGETLYIETLIDPHGDDLAAFALRACPGASFAGPSTDRGGGQFYLVVHGQAAHEQIELPPLSCVWASRDSEAPRFIAGSAGAEILVLQFPQEVR